MINNLYNTSRILSDIRIKTNYNGLDIDVQWFRVMKKVEEWNISRHSHSSFEFHIIAKGECLVETDFSSFIIKAGQFFITPPGCFHIQKSSNNEELIEYSLDCKLKFSNTDDNELVELINCFNQEIGNPIEDETGVIPLFESALNEASAQKFGYRLVIQSLCPRILIAMARSAGYKNSLTTKTLTYPKNRMSVISDFVTDNILSNISPIDIAKFMDLSEKQISRIVFASEGFSTKSFILQEKINYSKKLIRENLLSLYEISDLLKFTNASHFSKVFKQYIGIAPSEYRLKQKLMSKI
ncbi:MAG: helix-turn-helix transcriptional regulator [Spirochaetaceae bacterium]|nr:helix-turn-helix transcriptional regulator [Spirochaetaceae bacterium]